MDIILDIFANAARAASGDVRAVFLNNIRNRDETGYGAIYVNAVYATCALENLAMKQDEKVVEEVLRKCVWSLQIIGSNSFAQAFLFDSTVVKPWFSRMDSRLVDDKGLIETLSCTIHQHKLVNLETINADFSDSDVLKFASARLQGDPKFVFGLLTDHNASQDSLKYAQPSVRCDKSMILNLLEHFSGVRPGPGENSSFDFLKHVSSQVWSDQSFCRQVVQLDGTALQYMDEKTRADRQVVLAAVQSNGMALRYAAKTFTRDSQIVLAAVRNDGMALEHASRSLQGDKNTIITAISSSGRALMFVSEKLRDMDEIVLAAVTQDGTAFEYAMNRLKASIDFVVTAANINRWIIRFSHYDIQNDKCAMTKIVATNPEALGVVIEQFQDDPDVVLSALTRDGNAFRYASERMKNDDSTVEKAVTQCGKAFCHAHERFRSNKTIFLKSVETYPLALAYAHFDLQSDAEVVHCTLDNVSETQLPMFWNQVFCDPIKSKLGNFVNKLFNEEGDDFLLKKLKRSEVTLADTLDAKAHAKKKRKIQADPFTVKEWNQRQWERMWIVSQLGPKYLDVNEPERNSHQTTGSFGPDICRHIIEYANLTSIFTFEDELRKFENLINKMIQCRLSCWKTSLKDEARKYR